MTLGKLTDVKDLRQVWANETAGLVSAEETRAWVLAAVGGNRLY